jgi:hypothetical protein
MTSTRSRFCDSLARMISRQYVSQELSAEEVESSRSTMYDRQSIRKRPFR